MIDYGKIITTESVHEGAIVSTKREQEVSLYTTREQMLRDLIEAASVISLKETTKLTIELCYDSKDRLRIIKRWSI